MAPKKLSKTSRILRIHYLFLYFREVSMQELRNTFPGFSDKTFSRDITLLKHAGVPIRFSNRRKAFVLTNEKGRVELQSEYRADPSYTENKKENQTIDKLVRLTRFMDASPDEDCDIWYKNTFPKVSKRTMQRDFKALNDIGFRVYYKQGWEEPNPEYRFHEEWPPGHYYLDMDEASYEFWL